MLDNLSNKYIIEVVGDSLEDKVYNYFKYFKKVDIFEHTVDVVHAVKKLSSFHDFDLDKCKTAALLHDLGGVVELEDVVAFCNIFDVEVLEGEVNSLSILHQKASKIITEKVFCISDNDVLNSVFYHSTSRSNPSLTEMVVLVADKLSWRDPKYQAFVKELEIEASSSIQKAVLYYLKDLYDKREQLSYYHPYAFDAYLYQKHLQ